jgi:hypothetical protein
MKTSSRRRMEVNDTVLCVWFPVGHIRPDPIRGTSNRFEREMDA